MEQTSDNFQESRFGKFTASEVHRLMASGSRPMTDAELEARPKGERKTTVKTMFGDGAITYINEKIAECLTGESKPSVGSVATQWGLDNEVDAVMYFEMITGKKVQHFGVNDYKFFPYLTTGGCSPDGIIQAENANVQVKCPYLAANIIPYLLIKGDRQDWLKTNEYEYYVQCQFEMMCCNTEKCYFVVFAGSDRMIEHYHRMVVIELLPDVELQQEIAERVKAASEILFTSIVQLQTPDPIFSRPVTIHDTINATPVIIHDKI